MIVLIPYELIAGRTAVLSARHQDFVERDVPALSFRVDAEEASRVLVAVLLIAVSGFDHHANSYV